MKNKIFVLIACLALALVAGLATWKAVGQLRRDLEFANFSGVPAGNPGLERQIGAGVNLHGLDFEGETALLKAARAGNLEAVKLLLDQGAMIEEGGAGGFTPLMRAASVPGNVEIVRFLLSRGADVNRKNELGLTPIFFCLTGGYEITKVLLDAGANPNVVSNDGSTPLSLAKMTRDNQIIALLRSKGAKR